MDDGPNRRDRQGNKVPMVVWVMCAFVPSIAGIASLQIKPQGQWVFPCLLVLNILCSLAAAFGLVSRMKDDGMRVLCGLLLAIFLFFMNVVIVVFAGCSSMGRIAP
jgi:hypothetical protein